MVYYWSNKIPAAPAGSRNVTWQSDGGSPEKRSAHVGPAGAGVPGVVPLESALDTTKFLAGDGTWRVPPSGGGGGVVTADDWYGLDTPPEVPNAMDDEFEGGIGPGWEYVYADPPGTLNPTKTEIYSEYGLCVMKGKVLTGNSTTHTMNKPFSGNATFRCCIGLFKPMPSSNGIMMTLRDSVQNRMLVHMGSACNYLNWNGTTYTYGGNIFNYSPSIGYLAGEWQILEIEVTSTQIIFRAGRKGWPYLMTIHTANKGSGSLINPNYAGFAAHQQNSSVYSELYARWFRRIA